MNQHSHHDALFQGVFETALDAIITINVSGAVLSMNPAAVKLFGHTPDDVLGQNVRMLMPAPYQAEHDGYLAHYNSTGERKIIGSGREVEALHASGRRIPIHLSVSEAQVEGERVFIGFARDITDLKNAQADLDRSRRLISSVLETAADGIITINAQGIIQSINAAAERLFRCTRADMQGQNISTLVPYEHRIHHDGYIQRFLKTKERRIIGIGREVEAERRDGTRFPAYLSISHFRVEGEDFFTGVVRDITELKGKEEALETANQRLNAQNLVSGHLLELGRRALGIQDEAMLCDALISTLVEQVSALAGVFYIATSHNEEPVTLRAQAGVALPTRITDLPEYALGQGFVGQVATEGILKIVEPSPGTWKLPTGFGHIEPRCLLGLPVLHRGELMGVIELAFLEQLGDDAHHYLLQIGDTVAVTLALARDQKRISDLLHSTQAQSHELQVANEELDHRAQEFLAQQEALEHSNSELEEQKYRLEQMNTDLHEAQAELEEKALALEQSSKYKSEFLANMSHELRTPLNSILILSKLLAEDRTGNLTHDQRTCAETIASSGTDLLALINDILDLAKVEAGQMAFEMVTVSIGELLDDLRSTFAPLMREKGLRFQIIQDATCPSELLSDRLRLAQVLRNLLGNAHKFTESGEVQLLVREGTLDDTPAIAFEVKDSGVGIPEDQQQAIFEAFQQVDGTLNRRFGGTGLGLSISRDLAHHMGGRITVQSVSGIGSTFTLLLPQSAADAPSQPTMPTPLPRTGEVVNPRGKHILVVEDNPVHQRALMQLLGAHEMTGMGVAGCSDALVALDTSAFDGIILDLGLAEGSGFQFIEAWSTRASQPPVVIYTSRDLNAEEHRALSRHQRTIIIKGARSEERLLEELTQMMSPKPPKPKRPIVAHGSDWLTGRTLLVVDDDMRNIFAMRHLLGSRGAHIVVAEHGEEALSQLRAHPEVEAVLMDVMMPVMDGLEATELIRQAPQWKDLPIIAVTAKAMKGDQERCLKAGASDYLAKPIDGDALLSLLKIWLTR
ncbi:MAG: PAS domain S-box protein [Bradymonadia bacterium]